MARIFGLCLFSFPAEGFFFFFFLIKNLVSTDVHRMGQGEMQVIKRRRVQMIAANYLAAFEAVCAK